MYVYVGDCCKMLRVLGWALTRIRNLSSVLHKHIL